MKIGIVIAIARELNAFLKSDFKVEVLNVNHHEVYKTMVNHHEVYAIQSGCGLIDAASVSQLLISKFDVDLIINYGVTGALKPGLKVSDLFIVSACVGYGFDLSPIDPLVKGQYEEFPSVYMPLSKKYYDYAKNLFPELKDAICASGDKFIEKIEEKQELAKDFNCDICDMEIAAISRTAFKNGIDCLSIKCISDSLEGSGSDFHANVTNSANKAFNIIKELLFKLV